MNTTHNHKTMVASALGAAVAAASGIAIPLAVVILAAPANADTNGFEPPDPCLTATSCQNVHMVAPKPQPLPPGHVLYPIDDTHNGVIGKM
jgi:hypothetical protein